MRVVEFVNINRRFYLRRSLVRIPIPTGDNCFIKSIFRLKTSPFKARKPKTQTDFSFSFINFSSLSTVFMKVICSNPGSAQNKILSTVFRLHLETRQEFLFPFRLGNKLINEVKFYFSKNKLQARDLFLFVCSKNLQKTVVRWHRNDQWNK